MLLEGGPEFVEVGGQRLVPLCYDAVAADLLPKFQLATLLGTSGGQG